MATESPRRLSEAQQNELLKFLQSNQLHSIGTYALGRKLGEGSFGKVRLGHHTMTGQTVAIKIVDKIYAPQLVREIETWRHLMHPNIVQLYEVLTSETKIFLVMEYCNGGELLDHITKNGRMPDDSEETVNVFVQIVEAVMHCHEKNFAHRDLKLENILLMDDLTVKLIDFGFTRSYDDSALLDTYCGSSAYAAPEIVIGQKYTGREADIWSLGVVLYTMVCGYLPFDAESDSGIHQQIKEMHYEIPSFLGEDAADLIHRIFKRIPSERITLGEILNHPWTQKIKARSSIPQPSSEMPAGLSNSRLSASAKELNLAAKLEAAGFNIQDILNSVHTNACNQPAALWHLLLQKEVPESMTRSSSMLSNSPAAISPSSATAEFPTNKPFRIHITSNKLEEIFEESQQAPAYSAANPILYMASLESKESPPAGASAYQNLQYRPKLSTQRGHPRSPERRADKKLIEPIQSRGYSVGPRIQHRKPSAVVEEEEEDFIMN